MSQPSAEDRVAIIPTAAALAMTAFVRARLLGPV